MKAKFLTIKEAAEFLGVSSTTLRRWEEKNVLIPERTVGNQRRYPMSALLAFQEQSAKRNYSVFQPQNPVVEQPVSQMAEQITEKFSPIILAPFNPSSIPTPLSEPTHTFQQPAPAPMMPAPAPVPAPVAQTNNTDERAQIWASHLARPSFSFAKQPMMLGLAAVAGFLLLATTFYGTLSTPVQPAKQATGTSGVLAAETKGRNLIGDVLFNVPAIFEGKVTLNDTFEVNGESLFTEDITVANKNVDLGTGELTASNVVYGITAGANITISGDPQNPVISATGENIGGVTSIQGETGDLTLTTGSGIGLNGLQITNTGVLSVGGQTGTVSLAGGSGISVSGTTITNTDTGSAQSIFKTIIVGADAFSASSNTDSLTFEAGSGITITPDTSGKKLTFSGSAASGWSYSGSLLSLTNSTDNVSIGISSELAKLAVSGDTDEVQLLIRGNGTQTNNLFVVENASGTDLLVVNSAGQIISGSSNITLTTTTGNLDADAIGLIASDGTGIVSSGSGLETDGDRLGLLQGCDNGQILKWNNTSSLWECAVDSGAAAAVVNVENNELAVGTSVDTIDFSTDFLVGASPANEANVSLADDVINFTEIADSLTLDAAAAIALGDFNLTLGNNSGTGGVIIAPNAGGNAALVVNKQGSGDVFTASAAGTTRFSVTNTGNLQFSGNTGFTNILTSAATANRTYTLPDATGTICLSTGNCAGAGSSITGSGTATQLAFFSGGSQNIASDSNLYWDNTGKLLGIGTASPVGRLDVSGGVVGKALVILNETGNQDIFTASASGTTAFTLARTGNMTLSSTTANSDRFTFAPQSGGAGTFTGLFTSEDLTSDRTYTLPNATGTICLTSGNCAGIGGNGDITLVGSMASGDAFADGTADDDWLGLGASAGRLEFDDQTIDEINILSARLGIGTAAPEGLFEVNGAVPGKALAILNETGNQNILVGSASGVTRFAFDRSGNLNLGGGSYQIDGTTVLNGTTLGANIVSSSLQTVGTIGTGTWQATAIASQYGGTGDNTSGVTGVPYLSAGDWQYEAALDETRGGTGISSYAVGDMLYASGVNTLSKLTAGSSGSILSMSGGVPVWTDPGGTLNFWQRSNGALAPLTLSDDLLLGGTSTASARFAFTNNVGPGTPTASISANSGNNATYLTGSGSLGTTNMQRLSFGGSTTGGFNFQAGNDSTNMFNVKTSLANNIFTIDTTNSRLGFNLGGNNVPTLASDSQGFELQGALRLSGGAGDFVDGFTTPQGIILSTKINVPLYNPGAFGQVLALGLPNGAASNARAISIFDNRAAGNNQPPLGVHSPNEGSIFGLSWDGDSDDAYLKVLGNENIHITANAKNIANFLYTGNVGLGTSSPITTLDVTRELSTFNASGKALAIFNQTENQDILTASSAGVTRFTVGNTGNVGINTAQTTMPVAAALGIYSPTDATTSLFIKQRPTQSGDYMRLVNNSDGMVFLVDNFGHTETGGDLTVGRAFGVGADASSSYASMMLSPLNGGIVGMQIAGTPSQAANLFEISPYFGSIDAWFDENANFRLGKTATDLGKFNLAGTYGGSALAILNETGSNDIFTASASGTTRLTLTNSGNLNLIGGVYQSGGVSGVTQGSASCVTTTGGIVTGTGACQLGSEQWVVNNGAIYTGIQSLDFLLGGTSTASAKFAVLNMASGAPTASIAGSTAGSGLSINGDGTIATTLNRTLSINPNGGYVGIGLSNPSTKLEVGGTIYASGANAALRLGANDLSGNFATLYSSTGELSFYTGLSLRGGITQFGRFGIGLNHTSPLAQLDVRGDSGTIPIASFSGTTATAGLILDNNGTGDLFTASKSGATKFTILNNGNIQMNNYSNCATLTTTAAGVVGCSTIAASQNFWQYNNAGALSPFTNTVDLLVGGTSTASAQFAVTGVAAGTPVATLSASTNNNGLYFDAANANLQSVRNNTLTIGGSTTGHIILQPLNGAGRIGIGTTTPGNATVDIRNTVDRKALTLRTVAGQTANLMEAYGTTGNVNFYLNEKGELRASPDADNSVAFRLKQFSNTQTANLFDITTDSNGTLTAFDESGNLRIGASAADLGKLNVTGAFTGKALVVLNETGGQDIFTASASGTSRFSLTNAGGFRLGTGEGNLNQCLISGGAGGAVTWTDCAAGANLWQSNNGALSPFSNTLDLLVGGTSTASAKFAFINVNSGTPTASVSGTNNNALSLNATGILSTTNAQTLQLGNTGTGNVVLSPNGTTALTAFSNGNVTVSGDLNVTGNDISLNGNLRISDSFSSSYTNLRPQNGTLTLYDATNNQTMNIYGPNGDSALQLSSTNNEGQITTTFSGLPLYLQSNGGTVGINNSTFINLAQLDVRGQTAHLPIASFSGSTTASGLIVDNSGTGALFTASKAGATKFIVNNVGNVGIGTANPTSKLSISEIDGVEALRIQSATTSTNYLGMTNQELYLQRGNGSTTNLLISTQLSSGGWGSGEAGAIRFNPRSTNALTLNSSATTAIASVSGNTTNAGLIVDNTGTGALFTASKSGATKFIVDNGGNVGIGTATPGFNLDVRGSLPAAAVASRIMNSNASGFAELYLESDTSRFTLGSGGSTSTAPGAFYITDDGSVRMVIDPNGNVGFGTGTNAPTAMLDVAGTASISSALTFRNGAGSIQTTQNNTLSLGGSTTGNVLLNSDGGNFVGIGTVAPTDTLHISETGSGARSRLRIEVTGSDSDQDSLVTFSDAGEAVHWSMGADDSNNFFRLTNGGDLDTNSRLVIDTVGNFGIGTTTNPSELLHLQTLDGDAAIFLESDTDDANGEGQNPFVKFSQDGANVTGILGFSGGSNIDPDGVAYTGVSNNGMLFGTNSAHDLQLGTNSQVRFTVTSAGLIGSGTTSPLASFDIRNVSGTTAIASVSGSTTNAGLLVDNNGTGDIFTASKSGATKFTILNNGNIQMNNYTNCASLSTSASGVVGCSAIAASQNYWQLNNGAISPFTNTVDLLVGSTATSSAKFAITGVAGSTTTASVSGTTGGAFLTSTGSLQTTNNQDLTLGGGNTGEIVAADNIDLNNFSLQSVNAMDISDPGAGEGINFAATAGNWLIDVSPLSRSNADGNLNLYGTANNIALWRPSLWVYDQNNYTTATAQSNGGLDFTTTGTGNITFNPGGGVGVGTTTPLARLDVRGNSAIIPVASFSANTNFAGLVVDNNKGDLFTASSSGQSRFVIKQNGNVGIGTTAPTRPLEISGAGNQYARISSTNGEEAGIEFVRPNTFNSWGLAITNNGEFEIRQNTNQFGGSYNTFARFNAGTGLSINTGINSVGALHVHSIDHTLPVATFSGQTSRASVVIDQTGVGDLFTASKSGATKFVINNLGNVGIGTSAVAPYEELVVKAVAGQNTDLVLEDGTGTNRWSLSAETNGSFGIYDASNDDNPFYIEENTPDNTFYMDSSGQVGIGTDTPDHKLQVIGSIDAYDGGTQQTLLTSSGSIELANTGNGAFIDFKTSTGEDYDARIEAYGNGLAFRTGGSATQRHLLDANGLIGFNTLSPLATLDVRGALGTQPIASFSGQTARAGLIVDNNGLGDLFTASKSGATKFTINNAGNLIGANYTGQNGVLYGTQNTGVFAQATTATPGLCLVSGASAPTWGSCEGGIDSWTTDNTNGVVYTSNTTMDVLIGATSTTSAKFALINNAGGDPTFKINSVSQGIAKMQFLEAATDGVDFTYNGVNNELVISGTSEGTPIATFERVGNVGIGTNAPTAMFDVAGAASISSTLNFRTGAGSIQTTANNTLSLGGSSTGNILLNSDGNGYVGIGTTAPFHALQIGTSTDTGVTAPKSVYVGEFSSNGSYSNGTIAYRGNWTSAATWGIGAATNLTDNTLRIGTVGSTNPDFATNQTLRLILGGTAGASALGTLDVRGVSATTPSASVSANSHFASMVVDNAGTGDLFTASSSGLNRFVIKNNGNVGIGTTAPSTKLHVVGDTTVQVGDGGGYYLRSNDTGTSSRVIGFASTGQDLHLAPDFAGNGTTGVLHIGYNMGATNRSIELGYGSSLTEVTTATNTYLATLTGSVGIGTESPLATLDVRGRSGTTPVASFSGQSTFAGMVVDNRGTGDIFTASASGVKRFTVSSAGNVNIGSAPTNNYMLQVGNAAAGQTNTQIKLAVTDASDARLGAIVNRAGVFLRTDTGSQAGIYGYDYLASTAKNLAINEFGGQIITGTNATPLASLDIRGTNATLAIASVSGTTNFAALTVDNAKGDLFTASSSGLNRFVIKQDGSVGIGTTAPRSALDLGVDGAQLTLGGLSNGAQINFGSTTGANSFRFSSNELGLYTSQSNGFRFYTGTGTESTNPEMIIDNNGLVGINSGNNILGTLDVRGRSSTLAVASISGSTNMAAMIVENTGNGDIFTASKAGVTKFVIDDIGRVGIGTANPGGDLEVASTANPLSDLNDNVDYQMVVRHNAATNGAGAGIGFTVTNTDGNIGAAIIHNRTSTNSMGELGFYTKRSTTVGADPSLAMLIDDGGNVGIGTNNPGAVLDVRGITHLNYVTDPGLYSLNVGGGINFSQWSTGIPYVLFNAVDNGTGYTFKTNNAGKDLFRLDGSGIAGLGTPVDATLLATLDLRAQSATLPIASISGSTNRAGLLIDNTGNGDLLTVSRSGATKFTIEHTGKLRFSNTVEDTTDGNVKIFTGSIPEPTADGALNGTSLTTIGGYGDSGQGLIFQYGGTDDGGGMKLTDDGLTLWGAGDDDLFKVMNEDSNSTVFQIGDDGHTDVNAAYLEIDTDTDDNQRLCHSGADGAGVDDIIIRDCLVDAEDFAEFSIVQDANAEPGDVVNTFGPDAADPKFIVKKLTTKAYDMHSGVISTNPFVDILGDKQYKQRVGAKPIALAGRVPVKVSTENGPIKVGDPLAASSIPGVAMKATKASYVIGFAQEAYDGSARVTENVLEQERLYNKDLDGKAPYNSDPSKWQAGVGKIVAEYKPTWIDPSADIDDVGNITINGMPLSTETLQTAFEEVKEHTNDTVEQLESAVEEKFQALTTKTNTLEDRVASAEAKLATLDGVLTLGSSDEGLSFESKVATSSAVTGLQEISSSQGGQLSTLTTQFATLSDRLAFFENSASISGMFGGFIASSTAELGLDKLEVNSATVSGTLSVIGRTTLSDLGITGTVNVGLLSINGLDEDNEASINTTAGPLKLQSSGINGLDILDGIVTINTTGDIKTEGKITTKKVIIDTTDVASASLGTVTIAAGATQAMVDTTALTANSRIFATVDGDPIAIGTKKTSATAFTIKIPTAQATAIKVNWWIVN